MADIAESIGTLKIATRPGRAARTRIWLQSFVWFLCLVVNPIVLVFALLGPRTRVVVCERATARCSIGPAWSFGEARSFPLAQLADLAVYKDGKHAALVSTRPAGKPDFWGGDLGSDERVAAMQGGIVRLRGFAAGTEPSIRVELPNVPPAPALPVVGIVFVLGVFILAGVRRTIWRTEIAADGARVVVDTWRFPAGRSRTELRRDEVAAVRAELPRTPSGSFVFVLKLWLDKVGGGALPLVAEPMGKGMGEEKREIAERLGRFLGVPVKIA